MSSLTFTRVKIFISLLLALFLSNGASAQEWKLDLSRRIKDPPPKELSQGATETASGKNFLASLFDSSEPTQELVILNTDKGFVPATVRVRQDGSYRIHVVNVNDREKNVSFVLDAFSEHHATYFGKIKTFEIRPKRSGVFRFVSPETAAQGRLVVYPASETQPVDQRLPASEAP